MDNRINHIATANTQMATMLTQVNGMPLQPTVQQLGVAIPCLEVSHQYEHSVEDE